MVKQILDAGGSVNAAAAALGVTWDTAKAIIESVRTGQPPKWKKPGQRTGGNKDKVPIYLQIMEDVVRLKDEDRKTWPEIAEWLRANRGIKVSADTVKRAWDHAHRSEVMAAAKQGRKPAGRARYLRIGKQAVEEIRQRLLRKEKPSEIAQAVKCGISTVHRVQNEMRSENGGRRKS